MRTACKAKSFIGALLKGLGPFPGDLLIVQCAGPGPHVPTRLYRKLIDGHYQKFCGPCYEKAGGRRKKHIYT